MPRKLVNITELLDRGEWEHVASKEAMEAAKGAICSEPSPTPLIFHTKIADIIASLKLGNIVHFRSTGAWSHHQLFIALLEYIGPSKIFISTYAISETAIRNISFAKDKGLIQELNVLIDSRIDTRTAGSMQLVRAISDRCVLAACHAKTLVIEGAENSITVVGSANFTENKRIEVGAVFPSRAAAEFHKTWITEELQKDGGKRPFTNKAAS